MFELQYRIDLWNVVYYYYHLIGLDLVVVVDFGMILKHLLMVVVDCLKGHLTLLLMADHYMIDELMLLIVYLEHFVSCFKIDD